MAVTVIHRSGDGSESRPSSVTSFMMDLGAASWEPGPLPCAGDLVVLEVRKPATPVILPAGWTVAEDGRICYKVWSAIELTSAIFQAPSAPEWEVRGYVFSAGSYEFSGQ